MNSILAGFRENNFDRCFVQYLSHAARCGVVLGSVKSIATICWVIPSALLPCRLRAADNLLSAVCKKFEQPWSNYRLIRCYQELQGIVFISSCLNSGNAPANP